MVRQHFFLFLRHWRQLAASAIVGLGIAVVGTWIPCSSAIQGLLRDRSYLRVGALLLLVVLLLLVSAGRAAHYFNRYRRTMSLQHPPLLNIHRIAVAGFVYFLVLVVFVYNGVAHFPETSQQIRVFFVLSLAAGTVSLLRVARSRGVSQGHTGTFPSSEVVESSRLTHDDPIVDDSQDLLGRVPFVERLGERVAGLPFSNPFVLGLYGG